MTERAITIDELYNNHLDKIENAIGKATTILSLIISGNFEHSEESMQKDQYLALCYKNSYADIQSLLFILSDYVWAIKKEMETVIEAEIVPDEATA